MILTGLKLSATSRANLRMARIGTRSWSDRRFVLLRGLVFAIMRAVYKALRANSSPARLRFGFADAGAMDAALPACGRGQGQSLWFGEAKPHPGWPGSSMLYGRSTTVTVSPSEQPGENNISISDPW